MRSDNIIHVLLQTEDCNQITNADGSYSIQSADMSLVAPFQVTQQRVTEIKLLGAYAATLGDSMYPIMDCILKLERVNGLPFQNSYGAGVSVPSPLYQYIGLYQPYCPNEPFNEGINFYFQGGRLIAPALSTFMEFTALVEIRFASQS